MPKRRAHLKPITGIDQERRRVTGIARAGGEGSSVKAMERGTVSRVPSGLQHEYPGPRHHGRALAAYSKVATRASEKSL